MSEPASSRVAQKPEAQSREVSGCEIRLRPPPGHGRQQGPLTCLFSSCWAEAATQLIAPLRIGKDTTRIGPLMLEVQKRLHIFGRTGPLIYGPSQVASPDRSSLPGAEAHDHRSRCFHRTASSARRRYPQGRLTTGETETSSQTSKTRLGVQLRLQRAHL
jgi:hypothetical protein